MNGLAITEARTVKAVIISVLREGPEGDEVDRNVTKFCHTSSLGHRVGGTEAIPRST